MSRYHGSKNLWKLTKGSLGNNDGDGNENGKKSNKTISVNNNTLHALHAFMHICQPSLHDCDMKLPHFTRPLDGVGEHNTEGFFSFF